MGIRLDRFWTSVDSRIPMKKTTSHGWCSCDVYSSTDCPKLHLFLIVKVREAVAILKSGKGAGICNNSWEWLKAGVEAMNCCLHAVLAAVLRSIVLTTDRKRSLVVSILKGKVNLRCFNNYCAFILLIVSGNVLAFMLLLWGYCGSIILSIRDEGRLSQQLTASEHFASLWNTAWLTAEDACSVYRSRCTLRSSETVAFLKKKCNDDLGSGTERWEVRRDVSRFFTID